MKRQRVRRTLAKRKRKRIAIETIYYLIKWKGWSNEYKEWVTKRRQWREQSDLLKEFQRDEKARMSSLKVYSQSINLTDHLKVLSKLKNLATTSAFSWARDGLIVIVRFNGSTFFSLRIPTFNLPHTQVLWFYGFMVKPHFSRATPRRLLRFTLTLALSGMDGWILLRYS
jgi:hypothetical protein